MNTYLAIMAGGVGSRFWPSSTEERPKQFLDILGVGKSLLRLTYERFLALCPSEHIFIVTNDKYKAQVMDHIPELSENQVLCEPSRNNTAPSVAYTAFKLKALNPDANFIMAPSDHVILKETAFIERLKEALAFSENNDALLTLGIQPTRPDTGYGYINYSKEDDSPFKVKSFKEKPNKATAQSYLDSGDYLWNAGIFIWKASSLLKAFKEYAPEIYKILGAGEELYNTAREQAFINEYYPTTPSISVDFAIMEHAQNIYTIPADIGWSDLGTWASLHDYLDKDENGNVIQAEKSIIEDAKGNIIRLPSTLPAIVKGLEGYIVVLDDKGLLIVPKSEEQEVKRLRNLLL